MLAGKKNPTSDNSKIHPLYKVFVSGQIFMISGKGSVATYMG